jgi:putative ABC transport system permease protein
MSGGRKHLDDLDDEIRDHLERETQDNIDRGMTSEAAYYAARRKFGNVVMAKEDARAVWIPVWIDQLQQDARYGARTLRRNAGVSAVIIATLAIGIGANAAIFSVIRAALLKPPPYSDADRLVLLGETTPGSPAFSGAISAPNYLDWTQQNTVFEQMAAETGGSITLSGGTTAAIYVDGRSVSPSYFDVFGLHAALGRTFTRDEDQQAKAQVVVLSHRLWASQFGSDPAVIGKPMRLDGQPYIVIGVMPAAVGVDLLDPELWKPLTLDGHTRDTRDLSRAVAKLKRGVTLEQARMQMDALGDRLAEAYPASNQGWGVRLQSWPRPVRQDFVRSLYLLCAAVGMVLLIGCVNAANLALARNTARAHDVAIRAALGAGRGRLMRQFLTEHLIIAIGGGPCGLILGYAVLGAMTGAIPSTGISKAVPSDTTIVMDAPVWLFSLALSVLSGLAFGLGPALGATRPALTGFTEERGGSGVSGGHSHRRLRQSLVVAEVALTFVLLTTAGQLIQSFFALQQRIGAGFDSTNVLTARLPMSPRRFNDPEALNTYFDQLADDIRTLPGVRDVAFAEGLPTQGTPFGRSFQIVDQTLVERAQRPICGFKTVSPSYFRAVGLQILKGRALTDRDRDGTPFVLVINETFARMYFPGVDPIGKRLLVEHGDEPTRRTSPVDDIAFEVVGVVADEGLSWNGVAEALVYGTLEQNPSDYLALVVRGTINPAGLQESIRKVVSAFDPDQALANIQSLDQLKTGYMASDRLRTVLLSVFAAIGIALAATGLYGVLSYAVVQRTREIGIRAALGASTRNVVALVVRQGMAMTGWGLAVGLCGTLVASRLLTTFLFGVGPSNPTTIAAVVSILAAVALMACYIPARRAASVDPSVALRSE